MSGATSGLWTTQPRVRHDSSSTSASETSLRGEGRDGLFVCSEFWTKRLRILVRYRVPALVIAHTWSFVALYFLAYLVRFDGAIPPSIAELAIQTLPLVVAMKLFAFWCMGSFRGWWRYATFADFVGLAEAATLSSAAVVVVNYFVQTGEAVPRSIIVLDWAATILVIGGLRGSTRLFRERYYPMITTRRPSRVLVVGASEAGVALVRSIQGQDNLNMKVVGFLDNNRAFHGRTLGGIKVLGSTADVRRISARHEAKVVLVPTPAVPAAEVRELLTACAQASLKVQIVPEFNALLSGQLTVKPRDVDIHDLLCREPVNLDGESVGRFLHGRVVMVTGAAGSIGSEICRQVLAYGPERLVLIDHSENGLFYIERELRTAGRDLAVVVASITDLPRLRATLELHRPAVVFHAAAHKHVPMMEANPGEAIKNNVQGTRILVDEAVRSGVEAFVMISTDKAINPTSVMGASKRLAEMYVQSLSGQSRTRLVTVRFGNVLGSNGSVVPLFKEQIARGGPVTVTDPQMTRYFMTIPEATQLVLQAGALGEGGEIFVLDMGKPVRILDLARDMIRLSGMKEGREVEISFTGLRPGEKMYEELYDPAEERLPTPHPKIFRAKHRPIAREHLGVQLDRLARTAERPANEVIDVLKQLVPEYCPNPGRASAVRIDLAAQYNETGSEVRGMPANLPSPV